jgi:hypothetical protein
VPDATQLVTLPLRLGVRAARLVLDPLVGAAREALGLAGDESDGHREEERTESRPPDPRRSAPVAPTTEASHAEPASEPEPGLRENEPSGAPDAAPPSALVEPAPVLTEDAAGPVPPSEYDEPVHVSEEPVLVAESADPETADGIHTDLHVAEPWDGYRSQNAAEVIAALEDSSPAQIAVVQLYEGTHRRRKTVLEAAERQLRLASGPGRS